MTENVITLRKAESGKSYRVCGYEGGQEFKLRLKNLGLTEGRVIVCLHHQPFRGPVTIKAHNAKIAIGHGMAQRILVKPVAD